MMLVKIGNEERDCHAADGNWIQQNLNRHRSDGTAPCIRVRIESEGVNLHLTSANCPRGGGGRPPSPAERELLDRWEKLGLNEPFVAPGNLLAFLKQSKNYC